MKKAIVIGGSGFLGSHVADKLCESGFEVLIFDKIESPWLQPEQKMIVGDILDESALLKVTENCDVVYNFAAISDIDDALDKSISTIKINILGNALVLEACRKNAVSRYIYASTVYVYSREGGFYRCSKQAAENYIEEYQRTYGLDYTILRYGSLYGPRSDIRNGLWRIVKQALDSGTIRYEGGPEAVRDYIHVEDAAKASVAAAMSEDFNNQHVVLTGQNSMRVFDLLKMLAEILKSPNSVEFIEENYEGHYVYTPYAYQPKLGRKYVPSMHVDLGQGLLQLIDEIQNSTATK
jgi:UDP-glucose 4-epimerase